MGFWDFLFRASPVNEASGNKTAFPGVRKTRDLPEFTEEYASELRVDTPRAERDDSYSFQGVSLRGGEDAFRLTYNGILARDGAQDVFAVVGTGSNNSWQDVKYYPMQPTGRQTFETTLPVNNTGSLNVAFKDGADHWDNNSGRNYVYTDEGGS